MARYLYPALTASEVRKILRSLGFSEQKSRKTSGSHVQWTRKDERGYFKVTFDAPKAPFSEFLIRSMIDQAGSNRKEFYGASPKAAKKLQKPAKRAKDAVTSLLNRSPRKG